MPSIAFQRLMMVIILAACGAARAASVNDGLMVVDSTHDFAETIARVEAEIRARNLTVFAKIAHAEGAESAGLELPPTTTLIFGKPEAGTPLMQCGRTVAIDLPQKLLIWESAHGRIRLAYNDPHWLGARHGLKGCEKALENIAAALSAIAGAAAN